MGCNEDEYIKELQEENAKLLQEIRTLTNERVEFREEIKRLKEEIRLWENPPMMPQVLPAEF